METSVINRPPAEVATFDELTAQVHKLDQFYRHLMTEETDYGVVPGTKKPSLYKAGAELLRIWAGLSPQFEVNGSGSDLETGIFSYEVKCSLWNAEGRLIGEGVGNCNSLESKYRFRWAWPSEVPVNFDRDNAVKKTVKLKNGNQVTQYQVNNPNPQDLGNTILKMAKKRAFVDAILTVTGASRIFTQDVEDMAENQTNAHPTPVVQAKVVKEKPPASNPAAQKPDQQPSTTAGQQEGDGDLAPTDTGEAPPQEAPARSGTTITNMGQMLQAAREDFGYSKDTTLMVLGVKAIEELVLLPWEAYKQLKQHAARTVAARVGASQGA